MRLGQTHGHPPFATPSGGVAKDVSGYARLVNFNSFNWYRQYSERSLFMCLNHGGTSVVPFAISILSYHHDQSMTV